MIAYILRNENYIGSTVYNRKSFRLGIRRVSNPPGEWVRRKGVISAAVDRGPSSERRQRHHLCASSKQLRIQGSPKRCRRWIVAVTDISGTGANAISVTSNNTGAGAPRGAQNLPTVQPTIICNYTMRYFEVPAFVQLPMA